MDFFSSLVAGLGDGAKKPVARDSSRCCMDGKTGDAVLVRSGQEQRQRICLDRVLMSP